MHKITMYGFDQSGVDPHDNVPGRTLKTLLRMYMPKLQARIQGSIEQVLKEELRGGKATGGDVFLSRSFLE